jgi:hypothetical protein
VGSSLTRSGPAPDLKREGTWNGLTHFSPVREVTRDLKYSADKVRQPQRRLRPRERRPIFDVTPRYLERGTPSPINRGTWSSNTRGTQKTLYLVMYSHRPFATLLTV